LSASLDGTEKSAATSFDTSVCVILRGALETALPFNFMPKLKTHKGAAKRFKKTGTGKVVRHHAFARHILTSKTRTRKRRLKQSVVAADADQRSLKRMIPY
jgi:large subunit ribosomal protein L35